jgi:hypothetical protein
MSYCRFSSDNFRSDVYVYYGDDGYTCHIAARKISNIDQCPEISISLNLEDNQKFIERYQQRQAWMENYALRVPIKHDLAGTTFTTNTSEEMVEELLFLRQEGFHVPQNAIDALSLLSEDEDDTVRN